MKIAMLYAHWEDYGEPWSTPRGIREEFLRRGHDVRVYNLYHANGELPKNKVRQYSIEGLNILCSHMRSEVFEPDVMLVMDYGPFQSDLINKNNFPGQILIKECGDEPQSHRMHCQTASNYDILLSPDWECVERYRTAGLNAHWWTHHADTSIFYPRPDVETKWDCVTTCGSRGNGLTEKIKKELGERFNNERYFHGDAHAERLSMGKIVFQCSQFKEVTRRIFEGAACGRMVMTDRLPESTHIMDIFTEGEDIVYYDNADDAIEKIRYYSENNKERERIAKNGLSTVMANHTESSRVDQIEKLVGELL